MHIAERLGRYESVLAASTPVFSGAVQHEVHTSELELTQVADSNVGVGRSRLQAAVQDLGELQSLQQVLHKPRLRE